MFSDLRSRPSLGAYAGIFLLLFFLGLLGACGETPPADALNYDSCVVMAEEIPPTASDPHIGYKNVYACNITQEALVAMDEQPEFVYPEDTLIVKTSRREHQDYAWLVATARKVGGAWEWAEYKRNFENEDFLSIPVSQSVCIDCHKKASQLDSIYSKYGGSAR